MYKHILWDANNLFWRSYAVTISKHFRYEGIKIYTGAILNCFERIKQISDEYGFQDTNHYFLFDNPESAINIRKIISEGQYKHSREVNRAGKKIYKSLNVFFELLKLYSDHFKILWSEKLEADDLTLPLLESISNNDKKLLISADLDWSRNITRTVHWFNWDKVFTPEQFKDKYTFFPTKERIVMYKTIKGDKSDTIKPGIPHMPEKLTLHIITKYSDIDSLLKGIWSDAMIPDKWKTKISEHKTELTINYQLVNFISIDKPLKDLSYQCKRDPKKIRIWYNALKLNLEPWMLPKDTPMVLQKQRFAVH